MIIERHGFRYDIDATQQQVGQFVDGTYGCNGAVAIRSITRTDGLRVHAQINPGKAERCGLIGPSEDPHNHGAGHYDAALDVLSDGGPIVLQPGDSLVVTADKIVTETPQIRTADVFTCTDWDITPEHFRPSYSGVGADKVGGTGGLTTNDMHHPAPNCTSAIDPIRVEIHPRELQSPWVDCIEEWVGRYVHPQDLMPDYGRDIGTRVGQALLYLCTHGESESRDVLIALVQIGIDMRGLYNTGFEWTAMGGHSHGRMSTIVLAAAAFRDVGFLADLDATKFGEGLQTFIVSEDDVQRYGFLPSQVGSPEWGIAHAKHDNLTTPVWSDETGPYRFCCTANSWLGQALALRLMGLLDAVAHPAWARYVDAYYAWCKAHGKPGWYVDYSRGYGLNHAGDGPHEAAWKRYRLADMPSAEQIGYGPAVLTADTPASKQEMRMRVTVSMNRDMQRCILVGGHEALMFPMRCADVDYVPGDRGMVFVDAEEGLPPIDMAISGKSATLEIPLPPELEPGQTFVIQAFALIGGQLLPSNALRLTIQA